MGFTAFAHKGVAPGVTRLRILFVNAYFVDAPQGWVLVDTGLPGSAALIRRAAEKRYGTRPKAVILTHGHFDHAGGAAALAASWEVPVYAHPLELPYLTGRSDYPPTDPTMGGAIAQMSRLFPTSGVDLKGRVRPLPSDGSVPHLPGWRALHVPGHTAGQVALFRPSDRVLLAADALATVNLDALSTMLSMKRELCRPPAPVTTDWEAAWASVAQLARLSPSVVAAGHGVPMRGPGLPSRLEDFAKRLTPPPHGRYAWEPALTDREGVVAVPPPAPDPLLRKVLAGASLAGVLGVALAARRRRRHE